MVSLTLEEHSFDNFYEIDERFTINEIIRHLEVLEQKISSMVNRQRYKLIRTDERN